MDSSSILREFHHIIVGALRRQSVTTPVTEQMAAAIIDDLVHFFGGQNLYFPKRARLESDRRAEQIAAARDRGDPVKAIARKHGISERAVNKNIVRARQSKRKPFASQPDASPATLYQADIFPTEI